MGYNDGYENVYQTPNAANRKLVIPAVGGVSARCISVDQFRVATLGTRFALHLELRRSALSVRCSSRALPAGLPSSDGHMD